MKTLKISLMVVVLAVSSLSLQGCGMALNLAVGAASGLIFKGIDVASDKVVGSREVAENLPGLKNCNKTGEAVWACTNAGGVGDIFVVLKKSDDGLKDRQTVRKLVASIEGQLPSGLMITKRRPLIASPIFGTSPGEIDYFRTPGEMFSNPRTMYTGKWLVVQKA